MLKHSHAIIEEKSVLVHRINRNLVSNTVSNVKISELKDMLVSPSNRFSKKNQTVY